MVDVALSAGRLLVAFFLVFLNGFFVAAEFAFVKIRSTRVDALVEEGRSSAKLVEEVTENLDDYLAVSQLGITISSLGLGWIGEPAVAALIDPVLGSLLPAGTVHIATVAIGFGFITFLHVVFGELAPKTIAIQQAERIALLVAGPMKLFYYLFVPGIIVFNGTANAFTRLLGVSPASETDETHSEEEIRAILSQSEEGGHVDVEEVEMIEGVFELGDTVAREIMVPRPDVVGVSAETPLSELRAVTAEHNYTRYPVFDEETDDQVIGFVHVKDVFRTGESAGERAESITAHDLAREVLVVPESRRIDEILTDFQRGQIQMAVVIDEWGEFEGILTIEDIIEEIVGEIQDEFDTDKQEPSIEESADGAYSIDGGVLIETVNETLDADFESEGFDTVGGLVLGRLGRAPEVGDEIALDGYLIRVTETDAARIAEVVVEETEETEESGGAGSNRDSGSNPESGSARGSNPESEPEPEGE